LNNFFNDLTIANFALSGGVAAIFMSIAPIFIHGSMVASDSKKGEHSVIETMLWLAFWQIVWAVAFLVIFGLFDFINKTNKEALFFGVDGLISKFWSFTYSGSDENASLVWSIIELIRYIFEIVVVVASLYIVFYIGVIQSAKKSYEKQKRMNAHNPMELMFDTLTGLFVTYIVYFFIAGAMSIALMHPEGTVIGIFHNWFLEGVFEDSSWF
jgi:heme/copper-type cytochrome/quinol oxidase subunit 2